jgi:hypothetical protein
MIGADPEEMGRVTQRIHHELVEQERAEVEGQCSEMGHMRLSDRSKRDEPIRVEQEVERPEGCRMAHSREERFSRQGRIEWRAMEERESSPSYQILQSSELLRTLGVSTVLHTHLSCLVSDPSRSPVAPG